MTSEAVKRAVKNDRIYDSIEVNAYRHPVCRRNCIGAKWENC